MKLVALTALCALAAAAQEYTLGPDSQTHDGVPRGKVTKYTWNTSKIYPGSTRDYWVYVPAQYDGTKPACVMVFQDGGGFVSETGAWRVPVVFDNLIAQNAMPMTIGIFINPGAMPAESPGQQPRYNRSYEYDALGDRYPRFLIEEILPEVARQYKLSTDPNDRAVAGSSSGGIASFTVAWERPDAFHRAMSFIGSFANLRGGDMYANLIRKMEPKPLRVFLQDGSNDQNIYGGSWFLSNQAIAKSLDYAGYDVKFEVGTEAHNSRHGAAIFPDALRWLWHDYPTPIAAAKTIEGDQRTITAFLDPDHDWELVGEGYNMTEGPAVDRDGTVYFCDAGASKIYKVGADGKVMLFKEDTGGTTGLMFGADGRLYAAENARKRVVAYAPDGKLTVLATGVTPNDLAVTSRGEIYFTDSPARNVYHIDAQGAKHVVFNGDKDGNMGLPNGVRLTPDEALLAVDDTFTRNVWSFHIQPDGSLTAGQPFYHLELTDDVPDGFLRSGADGIAFDDQGDLFVTSKLGIQICDQAGRVVGIIRKPSNADLSNLVFGGPDLKTLYVTAGDKVFKRTLRRQGVPPGKVVKLPRVQL
jgi:sugar lactone lactonase YvrE/enterochelin esterase-like enzyme